MAPAAASPPGQHRISELLTPVLDTAEQREHWAAELERAVENERAGRRGALIEAFDRLLESLTHPYLHVEELQPVITSLRAQARARTIPAERLVPALRTALFAPTLLGVVRVRGVRLVASDLDWSFGRGPEVRGPAEAILMTVADQSRTGRGPSIACLGLLSQLLRASSL